jgi:DNA polymerase zeta
VKRYIHRLHLSIDHALAVSYRRKTDDVKSVFVAHIALVKGVPFYGYHVGYSFYLKVYMLNPLYMTRLADLLRQGTIMRKSIQPYESHLQYLAQWMCDFNLYGCAYIECKAVMFRSPVPSFADQDANKHKWHDRRISPSLISDEASLPRQSHCSLEVDICVQDILNRLDIVPRLLHHDFIERNDPPASDEKLVHSMAGLWRDETRRRRALQGASGSSPFPPEVLVSVSADPRTSQSGGWIHEEEYAHQVRETMEAERRDFSRTNFSFDTFIEKAPFETEIKTALESVEDLFPENILNLPTAEQASETSAFVFEANNEVAEVDESRVLSFVEEDVQYESDDDLEYRRQVSGDKLCPPEIQLADKDIVQSAVDRSTPTTCENTAEQSKDIGNPALFGDSQGPTSSNELEFLGIRDQGDYAHVDEDTFIVPTEYASDLTQSTKPAATRLDIGPPAKRRKLLHDEQIANTVIMNSTSAKQEGGKFPIKGSNHSDDHHDIPPSLSTGIAIHYQPEISKRKFSLLTPSSQGGYVGNDTNGNKTLSFPIVKDPHDPGTIASLSQQSFSPANSSQLSKLKSCSFETATGRHSEPSNDPTIPSSNHTSSYITHCATSIRRVFRALEKKRLLYFRLDPPNHANCVFELRQANIPSIIYQDAYYSDERDVPDRPREYAGKEFKIESSTVLYLPDFDPSGASLASYGEKVPAVIDKIRQEKLYRKQRRACDLRIWEIDQRPPRKSDILPWLDGMKDKALLNGEFPRLEKVDLAQIDSATQKNRHGFKYSQNHQSTSVKHETQYMSIMSLEVHINTREALLPNPEHDEIGCIFWCIQSEEDPVEGSEINKGHKCARVGVLLLSEDGLLSRKISQHTSIRVDSESNELDLINRLVDIVRNHDPDILTGYEVHNGSWGYIIERARFKYDYNLCEELSRMRAQSHGRYGKESDKWGYNHTSTIRVTGRHMINIWRAMRGELNLLQYTLENVVFHLLHRRIPHYSYKVLTRWYFSGEPKELMKTISYYVGRVQLNLEILDENELIARTSEQARLLGVDFFSVFSRGSQFKVESLMFRIAKPENYLLPSPSRKQVGQQNALECLPLVMEPQSAFYNSPLLVLDFQSLYPSVMIAYNYCYSTFLGRVVSWRGQNKMGFTDYQRQQGILELFKDQINLAPNGIIYAKPGIRQSLLAKMLAEIIETRVMVKSGMKVNKEDKALQRLLNNRQLALKLIANVTYGYTSASFSGRMPCSEIADSIVQTGRETLEKAIALIHSVRKWGGEVVYGDTDSLFVYLKGRTKDEAFDIGEEIAKTITDMNPRPVKLKFEKVYLPCILLAKKRYVGFKYETRFQKFPDFDAKGIETVRRDGTPGEQKIEEKALKLLFRSADLSQVKSYFQEQCSKIMKGKVSIQDFCFAKEVKLGTYSDKGVPPPGALISTRKMLEDPRAEPQYGERVPYVVITGAPGARLIDRCVAPEVLLENEQNELDADYYILKNLIPPLERIFNLVGANVRQWYEEMPKFQRIRRIETGLVTSNKELVLSKKTLEAYMKSSLCLVCNAKLEEEAPMCSSCSENAPNSLLILRSRLNKADKDAIDLEKVCRSCAGLVWGEEIKCNSKDCPVFYTRVRHMAHLRNTTEVTRPIIDILERVASDDLDW